jgi:hypothetical protein
MMQTAVASVFAAAMVTALVAGLGAVPFLFVRNVHTWWLSIANGAAGGLMLGASHNLVVEGSKLSVGLVLVGILIWLAAIVLANLLIKRRQASEIADLHVLAPTRHCCGWAS